MMTSTQLSNQEPYLIIHADGRITVSDKLKPDETAARVLECIKTQWMEDSQSKQIRELNQRIKQLEEMYEGEPGERPDLLGSNVMGLLKRELNSAQQRIKRLEEALTEIELAMKQPASNHRLMQISGPARQVINIIKKAKEAKL